jgi:putative peptidoglycan lipid II flippase
MPILSRLEAEKEGHMLAFMRLALLAFFVGYGIVAALVFVGADPLLRLIAPGIAHDASRFAELVLLTRIVLLQPMLLGLSNIVSNLTQIRHRFFLYSVSPLLYNIGIIVGIVLLYPRFGLAGLGWGVVFGAALHLLVQVPYFAAERGSAKLPRARTRKLLREVLVLSIPRTLALAATQLSILALVAIASILTAGSISIFMFAYNLQAVPLSIIGVSYAVAAFPTLSRLHAGGQLKEFRSYVEAAIRHIVFWSITGTVFVIVLRAQLVRVILGAGLFDWEATRLTAAALALFILSLTAQSLSFLVARAYYAAGNTKKPFYFGLIEIIIAVGSAVPLLWLFHNNLFIRGFLESLLRVDDIASAGVLMLALAYTLGSLAKFGLALAFFSQDFKISLGAVYRLAFQSFAASVIGGFAAYEILNATGHLININTAIGVFLQGLLAGLEGLLVTAGVLILLENKEIAETIDALHRKLKDIRKRPVIAETTEIAN